MPTYEQNKKYAAKWDKEHMATVSCKIRKETRDQFRAWAESQGMTVSGALASYVKACIGEPVENSVTLSDGRSCAPVDNAAVPEQRTD